MALLEDDLGQEPEVPTPHKIKKEYSYPVSESRRDVELSSTNVRERMMVVVRPKGESIELPPYKDTHGRWRTQSLFLETFTPFQADSKGVQAYLKMTPLFTLREHDLSLTESSPYFQRYSDHVIPSLRWIYLQYNDPTEFQFSMDVFKSTYHWKHLCSLKWFQPYVDEWRSTLSQKLRGMGISKMVEVATGHDPKFALQAGKWLAEGGFEPKQAKGRPSAVTVANELNREAEIERIYRDDAKRLGLEDSNPTQEQIAKALEEDIDVQANA